MSVLRLAATKGLLTDVVDDDVTYVNAAALAARHGVRVGSAAGAGPVRQDDTVRLRGRLAGERTVSVTGAYRDGTAKLTGVDGFALDLAADGVLVLLRYTDRPGVVGMVGGILDSNGVNIAAMQVARRAPGGEALMALTVDSVLPASVLAKAAEAVGATTACTVS
jgi:D-3-phosphoglycerate dehydrogenase